jgi:hypothetical protein
LLQSDPIQNRIDFIYVYLYRLRIFAQTDIETNGIEDILKKGNKGEHDGNFYLDFFHNPFHPCHAGLVDLEFDLGIQRRRETRQTRLAGCAADLIHELAYEPAYLVGVSSGFEAC